MADEDEGFLSRWSKRKSGAQGDIGEKEAQQSAALATEEASEFNPANDETESSNLIESGQLEMLEEADFEDIDFDELDKSSDYTRFIKANVPAAIQKRALRKLWASDSVFEVLDGMNDYDEDFTGNGLAGKIFKTAHQVGRGFITDEDDEPKDDESIEEAGEETSAESQSVEADDEVDNSNKDGTNVTDDAEVVELDNEDIVSG